MAIRFINDLDEVRNHNDRIYATKDDLFIANIKLGAHTEPESLVSWRSKGDRKEFTFRQRNCQRALGHIKEHRYQLCIPKKELVGYFRGDFVPPHLPSIADLIPLELRLEHLDKLIKVLLQYENYGLILVEEPLEFYFAIWGLNNVTLFRNYRVIAFEDEPQITLAFKGDFDRLKNSPQATKDTDGVIGWLQEIKDLM